MPCHQLLDEYLSKHIERCGLDAPKTPLFRSLSREIKQLGESGIGQPDAFTMVRRRARAAGIARQIGNHTFRATGITTYLKKGGTLENAAAMANHS